MNKGLKEKIKELHDKGYNYTKITKELNCSKGTVSYHLSFYVEEQKKQKVDFLKEIENNLPENKITFIEKYSKLLTSRELNYFLKTYYKLPKKGLSRGKVPKEYYSDRRREIKKELVDYKGGSCVICGYDKAYRSLHFHHLNPNEKDFTLGRKWGKLGFNDTIKKELDKCILVCANCHGEIHDGLIQI
jgi:predicted transcriptional regulator